MEVLVLDTSFTALSIFDTFESFIWTERYFNVGDFEIYIPVSIEALTILREDNYLWLKNSEKVMIIEDLEIDSSPDDGPRLKVTGRSLESILDRRIIWGQTILSGNLQNGIKKLLTDNAITPTIPERKINNLIFEDSTDPLITDLTVDAQYNGEELLESVQKLCEANSIGFKITLRDDNVFVFKLYAGVDRSYNQMVNPYVVFSPKFDNLINSNYVESKKTLKTVAFVAGEGEGSNQKTTTVTDSSGGGSDLSRREMYTDAGGVSSTVDGGTLTDEEYMAQLSQKGAEELAKNGCVQSFEGEVDSTYFYKYGEDFSMGDIVQLANEYGLESRSRVVEVVRSQSLSNVGIFPTFAAIA